MVYFYLIREVSVSDELISQKTSDELRVVDPKLVEILNTVKKVFCVVE